MKKIVAVICGLMVCLSMASAKKKSSGKFVLGLDDSFPPLGFRDKNNEIVGYDIDLADGYVSNIDFEVVFCPRYVWDDGTCAGYCDFGAWPDTLEPVKSIDAIPIGAVYKGLGNAYYRKISDTKSFTIWTENPDAIGRICVFKPDLVGMFSICHFFNFSFPEMT